MRTTVTTRTIDTPQGPVDVTADGYFLAGPRDDANYGGRKVRGQTLAGAVADLAALKAERAAKTAAKRARDRQQIAVPVYVVLRGYSRNRNNLLLPATVYGVHARTGAYLVRFDGDDGGTAQASTVDIYTLDTEDHALIAASEQDEELLHAQQKKIERTYAYQPADLIDDELTVDVDNDGTLTTVAAGTPLTADNLADLEHLAASVLIPLRYPAGLDTDGKISAPANADCRHVFTSLDDAQQYADLDVRICSTARRRSEQLDAARWSKHPELIPPELTT